jgi:8-oxo-dGTP pyrophosphatase MutT (NUDIX family)
MTAGIDAPDRRGRTGLDRIGRELTGNDDVRVRDVELLAGDRGNGATVLLDDVVRRTVLLTRQFRFPADVNGHPDGLLLETAAGLLVDDDPVTAGRREAEEETGHRVGRWRWSGRGGRGHRGPGAGDRRGAGADRRRHRRCEDDPAAAVGGAVGAVRPLMPKGPPRFPRTAPPRVADQRRPNSTSCITSCRCVFG